jgi:alpha-amylase
MKLAALCIAGLMAAASAAHAAAIDLSPVPATRSPVNLPAHWQHGVFMEVFVRGYQDSDGDGVGDLKGLISRLDHLQELGIKGLWLMPIQANADGDHGYATTDHRAVAAEYGTQEDFDTLLREAGRRGIGVIIDYVVNHSAAQHPLFVEARANKQSPWRDWFVFRDTLPADAADWDIWGAFPWYAVDGEPWNFKGDIKKMPRPPANASDLYFGTFGPHMPDFNMRNPAVVDYHLSSLRFWLNRGLAGYRLDAVPHLIENSGKNWNDQPESRALTKRIADLIRSYPNRYVVCEATAKPIDYGHKKLCGGAFAFGYVHHFVKAAEGDAASVKKLAEFYKTESPTMATFLSSHDRFAGDRLWDEVEGDPAALRLAAAGYLLQPGTPFIYYGEEVGQGSVVAPGITGDMPLRAPMSWTATGGFTTSATPFRPISPNVALNNVESQRADPNSILAFYKQMIALRNFRPSIARGAFEHSFADGLVLGYQRRLGKERTLVLINYGREARRVRIAGAAARAKLLPLYPALARGLPRARVVTSPPRSVQVFDLR